ncbi:DEAD/DEAH box helicase [Pelagicoccus sp. SDUM812003]|uniref:DEAD/DEAH box helicase n=1 Tax=Pelagicoccus sp. SDUM812003 TaxID=3041267 RepID=UPI0028105404|nr:DEAD/DEAH box helicase [Pelagicoccus sp. SDUM812003]MDQ8204382.1 DEAD/DEAH box helicase [Pelagicoccus sp. SDUM812003]
MNSFGDLDIHLKIPDLWQQQALRLLKEGGDVVVSAPTGAGKTYLVELIAESHRHGQIVLAVPTRALANDKLREFRAKGWRVGIVTGDVTIDPEAPVVVATLETQKPRFLKGEGPQLFVIDEYQMIGDSVRGVNFELCVALAPVRTQLLMLSGSVSNAQDIVSWLDRLGRKASLVQLDKRPIPLEEIHIDALSASPPRSVTGFWPRLIAKALMADLGPVLVFAPQRKSAEGLARQLAGALPIEKPLHLSPEQKRLAGGTLEKLLSKRVAFHHSGLSYQQRAGLVEPLAKAGQLRIVVATTGLAAGVNFSMRSVLVTESQFTLGHAQQLISPDELLQMYGRAGRRGLDTVGYALTAPDRPRLRDGKPRPVRRPKLLDWPSLIGILDAACRKGESPLEAAVDACGRLFNESALSVGVEHCIQVPDMPCGLMVDAERARYAQPESVEILNSQGAWEPRQAPQTLPLSDCYAKGESGWRPALADRAFVESLGEGKVVRLSEEGERELWGKRLSIGFLDRKRKDVVSLAGWVREAFAKAGRDLAKRQDFETLGTLEWEAAVGCGKLVALRREGFRVAGLFDLSEKEAQADVDVFGKALVQVETRKAYPVECQNCPQHAVCEQDLSRARSAALCWRQLSLIEPNGVPTLRGQIFSLFQGGEGLAVAAALEDHSYSVDAIAHDIANLRAGYRFDDYSQYSHRLARACRVAYSDRSYEGYLKHGLPPQYGEGAAEVIAEWMQSGGKGRQTLSENLRLGDVQRARQEWLSLLRHIVNAPPLQWERWLELQSSASSILETDDQRLLIDDLPPLEPLQTSKVNHQLRFPRKW